MSNEFVIKVSRHITGLGVEYGVDLVAKAFDNKRKEVDLNEAYAKGLEYIGDDSSIYCTLYRRSIPGNKDIEVGGFKFTAMPGCCGIVVSHGTYLTPQTRGTGLSNPFRQLKMELAKKLGYTMMIATTRMSDVPAVGNMMKSKYKIVDTFRNKRTLNDIGIGIKKL